ncbi:MAG: hypothetical protein Q8S73_17220 [Deltaproteobacteria bacterium]|nr:hypothetical protein [Myxococcales bacterium]MDP3215851.1 hypothetical protein [Deltaproteobacteria bacterium]
MYFGLFNAMETDPGLFVNRSEECEWLTQSILAWLARPKDATVKQSWCVHGSKGSGKTIFAKKVLGDVKTSAPQNLKNTLFLEVDCRRLNSSRAVYNDVAMRLVQELGRLKDARVKVPEEMVGLCQAFLALTRLEGNVEAQIAHENLVRFQAALGGKTSMLRNVLEGSFGLTFEKTQKTTQSLKGSLRFDDAGLCSALKAYFCDLRDAGFRVLLFLDNVDELQHEYRTDEVRGKTKEQAEWVLELADAPIATLVCMRSYFSGIARTIPKRALPPLKGNHLVGILEKRIKLESKEIQKQFAEEAGLKVGMHWLADRAPTPLAYLQWFQNLAERDAWGTEARKKAVREVIRSEYANVPYELVERVVRLYTSSDSEVDREKILAACEKNDADFALIQDRQVILPNDFWNPSRFTLDPLLYILHPSGD